MVGNWNMERGKLEFSLPVNMSTCKVPQAKYYCTKNTIGKKETTEVCLGQVWTEMKISHLHDCQEQNIFAQASIGNQL